jgi:hypothetical protein
LRSSPRRANVSGLSVALPKALQPSPTGPEAICSLAQVDRGRCPLAAKVGTALGRSPILSEPLRGSLYLAQPPSGSGPPDVWALMRGMGVSVKFRMKNTLRRGRLRGTLVGLPDIPLSSFKMRFASGKHGMFSLARSPCAGRRARRLPLTARLTAHNAATREQTLRLRVGPGCATRGRGSSR